MGSSVSIGIVGGGSWGTALAKLFCNSVDQINWYIKSETAIQHLKEFGSNPKYLSSVHFDIDQLNLSNNIEEVVNNSDIIVIATPSAFLYDLFNNKTFKNIEEKIIVGAVKGIIPEFHAIPARFFHKTFGVPYDQIAIIAGPCHAEEVAMERLSYLTIACSDLDLANEIADILECRYITTNVSDDMFGSEISAILKNVYAIASGICHGAGYGDNFQAILISNALREMERFVDAIHPIHRDVKSSAYMGDLLVTCYSQFSRNRLFGNMIGKGYGIVAAQNEMNMVAEGYYAVQSLYKMNEKFEVDIPIVNAVYRILYEKVAPAVEISILTKELN